MDYPFTPVPHEYVWAVLHLGSEQPGQSHERRIARLIGWEGIVPVFIALATEDTCGGQRWSADGNGCRVISWHNSITGARKLLEGMRDNKDPVLMVTPKGEFVTAFR